MKLYRTRKPLHNRHVTTTTFGMVKPVYVDFSLPGDIWKLKANCLIRCQPMLAPSMTQYDSYFRFFYVPLRLVLDKCEEIITGSKEGSLITSELPKAANFVKEWLSKNGVPSSLSGHCAVHKDSFYECLGVRPSRQLLNTSTPPQTIAYENYDAEENAEDFVAAYFYRAYCLIIWHYFRDENYQSFDGDFEKFYEYMLCHKGSSDVSDNAWYLSSSPVHNWEKMFGLSQVEQYGCRNFKLWFANLSRDYFMDTLPWIMKGAQPTINAIMHADFTNASLPIDGTHADNAGFPAGYTNTSASEDRQFYLGRYHNDDGTEYISRNGSFIKALNRNQITDGGFTAQDIRDMFAETRVFERLARTGSRYVEYLQSNFGIAPADDTLQRPVYLGGFTQPIVTTEVVQNGGDTEEVGTLRGHGISSGGNSIRPYVSKEFGIIFCLQYIKPRTQYIYQMRRKFTYKSRFDFFNPSFQLLSEQQTKNLEFFIPKPVLADDDTNLTKFNPLPRFILGYNRMYEELRKDNDLITGEMADTYSYWTSAINPAVNIDGFEITSTPPLNGVNICLATYMYTLLRPWKATNGGYRPFFIDFGISGSVFRPLVKNPQPGLVDHL